MSAPSTTARWRRRIGRIATLAALALPGRLAPQPTVALSPATAPASRVSHIADKAYAPAIAVARGFLTQLMRATSIPALSVSVAVDDRMVWSEGMGYADLARRTPATHETQYRIASLSKNVTGTALGLLIEQGRLDPDAPVSRYVPNLPAAWQAMTTRQVASHQSGIGHYLGPDDEADTTRYVNTTQALTRFRDRPPVHAPGEKETYSTYAYTLLAAVIEGASGQSYLDFLHDHLFAPLGMNTTEPDRTGITRPHRAVGYDKADSGRVTISPRIELSARWAGAGLLSTADDLARLGMAHTNGVFLREQTVDLLNTRQRLNDGTLTKEGFGWGPRQDFLDRTVMWGNGRIEGATSALMVYRKPRVVVSILTNLQGASLDRSETQVVAAPFVAMAEGSTINALAEQEFGAYDLAISTARGTLAGTLALHPGATPRDGFGVIDGKLTLTGAKYGPVALTLGWMEGDRLCLLGLDDAGSAFFMTGSRANGALDLKAHRITATIHAKRAPG